MSSPPNPLRQFRSYSYHHILVACNGAVAAEELANNDNISLLHEKPNGKYKAVPIKGGSYIVVINGMTDAVFSIVSAKWATVMAPQTTSKDGMSYADTMELDGELVIQEPRGVRFLNVLANVCDELKTDPTGVVYLLKTIFVGHTNTGSVETISTVRPLLFQPIDITAVIDQGGAIYTFAFVGVNNGVGKLPHVSKIANGMNIQVGAAGKKPTKTLKEAMKNLQTEIKKSYKKYKADLLTQAAKVEGFKGVDFNKNFRDVTYTIVLDKIYKGENYHAGTAEKVQFCETEKNPTLSFTADATVEDVIRRIMNSSAEVLAEAKASPDGSRHVFKITSTLKSNADVYNIEYQVQRFRLITTDLGSVDGVQPKEGEFIEFDYIFTGKNVDIIEFDIKMEMGMAFFQTIATANNVPTQEESITGTKSTSGAGTGGGNRTASGTHKERSLTPLFLGTQLSDPMIRNKQRPLDALTFNAMLARHAAFENIEAKMKIHGNPQLLDEMSILPSEMDNQQTENPKPGKTINPNWLRTPSLAKVNIMMPSNKKDEDFAEPFWYDGYYMIYTVDNIFDGGQFTQVLDLISLPVTSEYDDVDVDITPPYDIVDATNAAFDRESSPTKKDGGEMSPNARTGERSTGSSKEETT